MGFITKKFVHLIQTTINCKKLNNPFFVQDIKLLPSFLKIKHENFSQKNPPLQKEYISGCYITVWQGTL